LTALTEEEESDDEDNEDMNVSWWKGNFIADPRIAPFRAVVERTIGAMKRWQILTNEPLLSRLNKFEMNQLVQLIAALTNFQLKYNKTCRW